MNLVVPMRLRVHAAAIAFLSVLQGCGGGGDQAPPPAPPPAPADAHSVALASMKQPHDYSLGVSAQGLSFAADLEFHPGGDVRYQGVAYATTNVTATVTSGESPVGSGAEILWLDKASGQPKFYVAADGSCGVVTSARVLAGEAAPGSSGSPQDLQCASSDQAMVLTEIQVVGGIFYVDGPASGESDGLSDNGVHPDMPGPILRGYPGEEVVYDGTATFDIMLVPDPLRTYLTASFQD